MSIHIALQRPKIQRQSEDGELNQARLEAKPVNVDRIALELTTWSKFFSTTC